MSTANYIWFNGDMVPWDKAQVHVMSHALHYGSSVFEGIRAYNTPKGPVIFRLEEHVQRLFDSAKIYRMNIPYTKAELMDACREAVAKNELDSAYLRPLVFIGNVGMGLNAPRDVPCEVIIAAIPWGAYLGEEGLANGVDVCVTSWNRLAPNTMPTGAKAGGNYLSSQLISGEAKRHGYTEGISLDVHGHLSEGAGENLFLIKNKVLYHHAKVSFRHHHPRPQHGRRPRPVARHRHDRRGFRQADHRRGQLLHPVRARPRAPQGSRASSWRGNRGRRRRGQGVQHHRGG
jgi:branched-chain amino acid aminotransferase